MILVGNPLPLIFSDFDWFSMVFHWLSLIGSSLPSLRIAFWHSQAPQSIKFNIFSLIFRDFQQFSLIPAVFHCFRRFSSAFIDFESISDQFSPLLNDLISAPLFPMPQYLIPDFQCPLLIDFTHPLSSNSGAGLPSKQDCRLLLPLPRVELNRVITL